MMKTYIRLLALAGVILSLAACGRANDTPTPEAILPCPEPAITLGDVEPVKVEEVIADMQLLAQYLADRLGDFGIKAGCAKLAPTVEEMAGLIENGVVDVYFDSLYPAWLIRETTHAQPILRQWRDCDPEYYSVIVVRADSGIQSIGDLPGHVIAMDHRYSTSGFLMPAAYLIENGLTLVAKDDISESVAPGEIGIWFSKSDDNSYAALHTGKVDAAATDDFRWGQWQSYEPGELILLARTESMPRRAVMISPQTSPDLREAIRRELIEAESNSEGSAAIEGLVDTCRFDDLPGGIETAFTRISQMDQMIQSIPGLGGASQP